MSTESLFGALVDFALARGGAPMNRHVGCWEQDVDGNWFVAVNGHGTPTVARGPAGGMGEVEVPPFHMAAWWCGWLAGFVHPLEGGAFAGGAAANPETLEAALRAAVLPECGGVA